MKSKSLLILIGIVVVLGLWAFSGYNGMVDKEEVVTTALGNVEAAYQRRADMMPALAKIVKAYAKHERGTLKLSQKLAMLPLRFIWMLKILHLKRCKNLKMHKISYLKRSLG